MKESDEVVGVEDKHGKDCAIQSPTNSANRFMPPGAPSPAKEAATARVQCECALTKLSFASEASLKP